MAFWALCSWLWTPTQPQLSHTATGTENLLPSVWNTEMVPFETGEEKGLSTRDRESDWEGPAGPRGTWTLADVRGVNRPCWSLISLVLFLPAELCTLTHGTFLCSGDLEWLHMNPTCGYFPTDILALVEFPHWFSNLWSEGCYDWKDNGRHWSCLSLGK